MGRIAPCAPARPEAECLGEFLRDFGKRAYRRPLTAEETSATGRCSRSAAEGATSPAASPGGQHHVAVAALPLPARAGRPGARRAGGRCRSPPTRSASRLSYFLQNTMPDQELFAAAEAGRLGSAEEIAAQARRLLESPKARDSVVSFYLQWLQVDDLLTVEKDPEVYPMFTPELRAAMREEIEEFVDQVGRAGRGGAPSRPCSPPASPSCGDRSTASTAWPGAGGRAADLRKTTCPPASGRACSPWPASCPSTATPTRARRWARATSSPTACSASAPPAPPEDVDVAVPKPDPNVSTRVRFEQHRTNPDAPPATP